MHKQVPATVDVAIVGCGPVGASLAALLGQRGHRVAVFDKSGQIYPLPRAFALDHEVMRIFQGIGIAPSMAGHMAQYRPTLYLGADGRPVQHFDMGPPPYPLGWAPAYTFNQPALETALRAAVAALPSVSVHLEHEVLELRQAEGEGAAGATLVVRTPADDTVEVRARYVVACDGGTSPIRRRLGLPLKSLEFDEPWIVVDLHVDEAWLGALPQTNLQNCNPARPSTYVVGPGTHRRWEFLLLPEEAERREMPHEAIWQLLAPWLQPHQARIWRAATYRFHAVVLERWRQGPVLLAGDAAHQMPPFLAQGMCQGIRDAANLAWKLDWVLAGRAGDALLDTYGQERGPQVEELTATVKRLGQIICERDPAAARVRDVRLRAQQGGTVAVQMRQGLLPGIRQGLVDGRGAPAGTPFPQPLCRNEPGQDLRLLDVLLPPGFTLMLRRAPAAGAVESWSGALSSLGARVASFGGFAAPPPVLGLAEAEGVADAWFDRYGCVAALVRPDHIVYGMADCANAVLALLKHATEQIRPYARTKAAHP